VSGAGFLLTFLAAAVGGAINSMAGGGTLVTFPAIVWLGVPPISANATSTVALWPGSFGSIWAYRGELADAREWLLWFTLPSLAGGGLGAFLLLRTSAKRFDEIVPFLVLGATLLFLLQQRMTRRLSRTAAVGLANQNLSRTPSWITRFELARTPLIEPKAGLVWRPVAKSNVAVVFTPLYCVLLNTLYASTRTCRLRRFPSSKFFIMVMSWLM